MKRLLAAFLTFGCCSLMGQSIDVTEFSQNIALRDTVAAPRDSSRFTISPYPSVSETYQIPAYSLYQRHWDVDNLRSRELEIPFSNDRLTLLLVQEGNHNFVFPCISKEVSCPYGPTPKGDFHPGLDLSVEPQTLVKSCFDGVVRMAKPYGAYGLVVVIRHYNGLETVYGNLGRIGVKPGQMVNAGDIIGQAADHGNAPVYTLHFETRFMNEHFNPELMIDFEQEGLIRNTLTLSPDDIRPIRADATGPTSQGGPAQPPTGLGAPPRPDEADSDFHIVRKGEGLYRIALQHHTTIERIMQLNHLDNPDKISEGQKLKIK